MVNHYLITALTKHIYGFGKKKSGMSEVFSFNLVYRDLFELISPDILLLELSPYLV